MSEKHSEDPNACEAECDEKNIKMMYLAASKEALMWKKRYLDCAKEKASQLGNIETSLMVLESRLETERNELERRFRKQHRTIKDQKRKIAKLTTVNQKLLNGLMALSDQAGIAPAPPPYSRQHMPPQYKSSLCESNNPVRPPSKIQEEKTAEQENRRRRIAPLEDGLTKSASVHRTQRSQSLPVSRYLGRNSTGTNC